MKFKKMLAVVSALCMMCAVVPVLPVQNTAVISASAEDTEYLEDIYENLTYKKYADYVEISGVIGKEITEVNIPAEIDGLPVTSIGNYAFAYFPELTSVTIPDSVTSIGEGAFFLSRLTSVTILDSVTSIGDYAFKGELTSIEVPENNPAYTSENGVLFNKEKTILIAYPAGNTRTEYMIPSGVTSIARLAFSGCSGLTSVTIPDSVTSIGGQAFEECSGLTSVTLPESVTSIGKGAFYNCSVLTSVTIKNPDCEIYDSELTISNNSYVYETLYFNGKIYGYENSTAQAYAEKYGFKFVLLEEETKELTQGDADGSGKIDILDVITVNRAILGKEKLTDEQLKAVDFNSNGKPESSESLMIMKYIVGLITSFTE